MTKFDCLVYSRQPRPLDGAHFTIRVAKNDIHFPVFYFKWQHPRIEKLTNYLKNLKLESVEVGIVIKHYLMPLACRGRFQEEVNNALRQGQVMWRVRNVEKFYDLKKATLVYCTIPNITEIL